MDEYKKRGFAKAVPYVTGGTVGNDKTYLKTGHGGFIGDTEYFCKLTNSRSIGDAFGALSMLAKANKEYESHTF